jgi:hypothetical protein
MKREREREREIVRFPPGTSFTPLGFEARVKWFYVVPDETIGSDSDSCVLMFRFRQPCFSGSGSKTIGLGGSGSKTLDLVVPVRKRLV